MYFIIRKVQVVAGPFSQVDYATKVDSLVEDIIACADTGYILFRFTGLRWEPTNGRVKLGRRMRVMMQLRIENRSTTAPPQVSKAADMVNAPPHYNQAEIECIDAIAAATINKTGIEAVNVANVIKYLWRYEAKNGVEDVKKARWYLDRLLGELEK